MFSHVFVGSNDLEASRKFYDATFAVLGIAPGVTDAKGRLVYYKDATRFLVTRPIDGKPATFANGGTIGLRIENPETVRAWHDAGVASGGTSIEDPPGIRQAASGRLFLAYLRDPDGNKLCGRCQL